MSEDNQTDPETPKTVCKTCKKEGVPLYGPVMGLAEYCEDCNEKFKISSGRCGICRAYRWNCCC